MKKVLLCAIGSILLVGFIAVLSPQIPERYPPRYDNTTQVSHSQSTHEVILKRELEGFFMDIPEVVWCKFVKNTVYVGFEPYPHDGEAILRGAALHGNEAINFGCHIWAVHNDQKNNPPHYGTLSNKWYDEVTVRYGKFE